MSVIVSALALAISVSQDGGLFQPNQPPTGTLALPPVGAELGVFGKWERPAGLALGKEPRIESKKSDIQIKSLTTTRVDDPYGGRGHVRVDVVLTGSTPDHYVDLYVAGYYMGVIGEVEGVKDVGRRPAYEFARVHHNGLNKHPTGKLFRTWQFRVPDVLPAKVRAELYQIKLGKPARLLATKETGFDTDFKDMGVLTGYLFGVPGKSVTKASFLVLPGTESVSVRVPALKPLKPGDFSNDLTFNIRTKGRTEVHETLAKDIQGRGLRWKATCVSAGPLAKDRDTRNNEYWPGLKDAGYLDVPPVRVGSTVTYPGGA
ncbi:MAG: hypothetical protein KF857_03430 [Fimbriimonadaceae bacterium]|nr:hypothetical protein [Fimbriimonadaceae bacterium]